MRASIIVVTWNCAGALSALAESMTAHLDPELAELVVVDNASGDDPFAAARRWRGRLETASFDANRGFGAAANEGVRLARGDAAVLLNPDTWLVDSSLLDLAAAALRLDALVGPRVLNPDGTAQPSASAAPVGAWPWVRALVPQVLLPRAAVARTEPWRLSGTSAVAWLTGVCIAAPRAVLARLGPFDERIEMYAEDLDLGLRAGAAGIRSWFLPDVARVFHVGDVSSRQRFADAGIDASAAGAAKVLARTYGKRRADRALAAELLRLRLRWAAKSILARSADREQAWRRSLSRARAELVSGEEP